MNPKPTAWPISIVAVLLLALPAGIAQAPDLPVTCTFVNPAYAGSCVASTTRKPDQKPRAACRPILNCLNNPLCMKTYCQATTVRQGWKLKAAK